jgi:hypothetical protein
MRQTLHPVLASAGALVAAALAALLAIWAVQERQRWRLEQAGRFGRFWRAASRKAARRTLHPVLAGAGAAAAAALAVALAVVARNEWLRWRYWLLGGGAGRPRRRGGRGAGRPRPGR